MPTTTKRFYIVKADDHAVVKSVPVSVCAAPPRVDIAPTEPAGRDAPTCPVEPINQPQPAGATRVADVVKHVVRKPASLPRPHLPHIGRPGR